jgi:hypothetical protein
MTREESGIRQGEKRAEEARETIEKLTDENSIEGELVNGEAFGVEVLKLLKKQAIDRAKEKAEQEAIDKGE